MKEEIHTVDESEGKYTEIPLKIKTLKNLYTNNINKFFSEQNCSTPVIQTHNTVKERPAPVIIKVNRNHSNKVVNPAENKARFVKTYKDFIKWRETMKLESTTESVLLNYFEHLSSIELPTVLQNIHSMLKTMLILEEGLDINQCATVNLFLENLARKKISLETLRKNAIFTSKNISDFINNAPDEKYLATKVNV